MGPEADTGVRYGAGKQRRWFIQSAHPRVIPVPLSFHSDSHVASGQRC